MAAVRYCKIRLLHCRSTRVREHIFSCRYVVEIPNKDEAWSSILNRWLPVDGELHERVWAQGEFRTSDRTLGAPTLACGGNSMRAEFYLDLGSSPRDISARTGLRYFGSVQPWLMRCQPVQSWDSSSCLGLDYVSGRTELVVCD